MALATAWQELAELHTVFEATRPGESPFDHIRAGIRASAQIWRRHEHLLAASFQARGTGGILAELWDESSRSIHRELLEYITTERAAGHTRPVSDDLEGLVTLVLDMVANTFYRAGLSSCDPAALDKVVDLVTAVVVAALWGSFPQP